MLTGLQSGFISQHWPQYSSSSGLVPSCPPYWMMFSSPRQSCLASCHYSDILHPNPRQRSHSLNPSVLRSMFVISSDSENEKQYTTQKAKTCLSVKDSFDGWQRKGQRAFVPDFLNPPACLSSLPHQRRKNLRQCSLSGLDQTKQHAISPESPSNNLSSNRTLNARAPKTRANAFHRLSSTDNHDISTTVRNLTIFVLYCELQFNL